MTLVENLPLRKFDLIEILFKRNNSLYQPLTLLTFAIEHKLFGLNPAIYHLDNLLLHVVNTLFLYFIFIRVFGLRSVMAAGGALIFGIHPMSVESVAWITERKDVLTGLFFLSSFYFYTAYANSKGTGQFNYLTSLMLFSLGLLAKPMVLTLSAVIIAYDLYSNRKPSLQLGVEKLPFFGLSLFSALTTLGYIFPLPERPPHLSLPLWDRLENAGNGLIFYLSRFIYPRSLSAYYEGPLSRVDTSDSLIALGMVALYSVAFWKFPKIRRELMFGLVFFLVTVSIVLQLIPFGPGTFQDHYLYLPSIGLVLVCLKSLESITETLKGKRPLFRRILIGGAGLFLLTLAVHSWQQTQAWKNQESLSLNTLRYNPGSPRALSALGQFYMREGKCDKAIEALEKVVATGLDPEPTYLNLGICYSNLGQHQLALETFEKASQLSPDDVIPLNNQGFEFMVLKSYEQAESLFKEVIRKEPNFAMGHKNLGQLYFLQNRLTQARDNYSKALELDPFLKLAPEEIELVNSAPAK